MDGHYIWSNLTTGATAATTSIGMEFGQGYGPRWLDNVQCNPTTNRTLLECDHVGANYGSCRHHDAAILCLDEQQVRNIAVHIVNTGCVENDIKFHELLMASVLVNAISWVTHRKKKMP